MNQEIRTFNILMKIKASLLETQIKKKKKTLGHLTIPSDGETKETGTLTS